MRGMGLDDDAMARPFIGIVSTAAETSPCNGNLAEQAAHATPASPLPAARREHSRRYRCRTASV